jgi:hypothetical protein
MDLAFSTGDSYIETNATLHCFSMNGDAQAVSGEETPARWIPVRSRERPFLYQWINASREISPLVGFVRLSIRNFQLVIE